MGILKSIIITLKQFSKLLKFCKKHAQQDNEMEILQNTIKSIQGDINQLQIQRADVQTLISKENKELLDQEFEQCSNLFTEANQLINIYSTSTKKQMKVYIKDKDINISELIAKMKSSFEQLLQKITEFRKSNNKSQLQEGQLHLQRENNESEQSEQCLLQETTDKKQYLNPFSNNNPIEISVPQQFLQNQEGEKKDKEGVNTQEETNQVILLKEDEKKESKNEIAENMASDVQVEIPPNTDQQQLFRTIRYKVELVQTQKVAELLKNSNSSEIILEHSETVNIYRNQQYKEIFEIGRNKNLLLLINKKDIPSKQTISRCHAKILVKEENSNVVFHIINYSSNKTYIKDKQEDFENNTDSWIDVNQNEEYEIHNNCFIGLTFVDGFKEPIIALKFSYQNI